MCERWCGVLLVVWREPVPVTVRRFGFVERVVRFPHPLVVAVHVYVAFAQMGVSGRREMIGQRDRRERDGLVFVATCQYPSAYDVQVARSPWILGARQ